MTDNPGDFLLGQIKEMLSISQNLACILDARTSLARIGLNVLQGSTFIQPGQGESYEALEISNISGNPIKIYSGMKIVKGIFILLKSKSTQNYSETGEYGKQSKVNAILK
jgi:deoxycytidine triphosphate deaminase